MTIETKELVISEELKRKVEIFRFAYVEYEFINDNIKSIKNRNIAYVKPHILKVKVKGMSKKQIRKWVDTCMDFVYEDLGY